MVNNLDKQELKMPVCRSDNQSNKPMVLEVRYSYKLRYTN